MSYRARNCRPVRRRQIGQLGTKSPATAGPHWDSLRIVEAALLIYAIGAMCRAIYLFLSL